MSAASCSVSPCYLLRHVLRQVLHQVLRQVLRTVRAVRCALPEPAWS
jgi:hypothetical protein